MSREICSEIAKRQVCTDKSAIRFPRTKYLETWKLLKMNLFENTLESMVNSLVHYIPRKAKEIAHISSLSRIDNYCSSTVMNFPFVKRQKFPEILKFPWLCRWKESFHMFFPEQFLGKMVLWASLN